VWRTHGICRKEMKRGYSKKRYHQRSKDETIFSVVKRTMGDEVRSIRTRAQNNEIRFRVIAYNAARITSLAYSLLRGFLQSLRSPHKSIPVYNKASSQRPHATILNERLMLQNLNRTTRPTTVNILRSRLRCLKCGTRSGAKWNSFRVHPTGRLQSGRASSYVDGFAVVDRVRLVAHWERPRVCCNMPASQAAAKHRPVAIVQQVVFCRELAPVAIHLHYLLSEQGQPAPIVQLLAFLKSLRPAWVLAQTNRQPQNIFNHLRPVTRSRRSLTINTVA
jgi:hypothetical protein